MKILGFIGPKGSGKDASAKILKDNKVSDGKLSFAGPLKELCSEVFNIPLKMFNDPEFKEQEIFPKHGGPFFLNRGHFRALKRAMPSYLPTKDPLGQVYTYSTDRAAISGLEGRQIKTYRELLQIVGTDFIRNRVFEYWHVMAAFSSKALDDLDGSTYCVTDIRFPNELKYLQDKFGEDFEAYYVERPKAEKALESATHVSELGIKDLKALIPKNNIIKNDKTLKALEESLSSITSALKAVPKKPKERKSKFVYGPRN